MMNSTVAHDQPPNQLPTSPSASNGRSVDKTSTNGKIKCTNASNSSEINGSSIQSVNSENCERVSLTDDELANLNCENFISHWRKQDLYIDSLESRINQLQSSLTSSTKEWKEKLLESTRRENLLILTVSCKERQILQLNEQLNDVRRLQLPSESQLRSTLLDPAVNLLFERMKKEVTEARLKVEETENELSAWKFTPDSNTGKRLMAKCRMLHKENEELGKVISSGRLAKLEGELELQKELSANIEKSQSEIEELVVELEENSLGLQSTIINLQQQLKECKENEAKLLEKVNKVASQAAIDDASSSVTASVDQSCDIEDTTGKAGDTALSSDNITDSRTTRDQGDDDDGKTDDKATELMDTQ